MLFTEFKKIKYIKFLFIIGAFTVLENMIKKRHRFEIIGGHLENDQKLNGQR